ncbi:MAG: hypothetical protein ABFD54_06975 [Armatimonadota bacterium]
MNNLRAIAWNAASRVRGDTLRHLQVIRAVSRMSREDAIKDQNCRLSALIAHAYRYVPYYRKVMDGCGVVDGQGNVDLSKFHRVPFLERSTLSQRNHDLRSTKPDGPPSIPNKSGGTTGMPITFLWDESVLEWVMATKDLYDEWTGYYVGMPQVRLWGSERDVYVGGESLRTTLGRWLRNEIWLNSYKMSSKQMREYIDVINAHRPVQILGYVGCTYELARFAEREGCNIYSPKAVMTSAGTLHPYMRETIERVFRAPVFNRYGTRETGDIACECSVHDGLHICMPTHYVEIVRPDGSPAQHGEEGEVILTLLTNYTMPLIRYRVGDTAILKEGMCACGVSWPMLEHVTGRLTESFLLEDGGIVPAEYLNTTLYNSALNERWIKKCQCIQDDYNSVCIRIVPWDNSCSAEVTHSEDLVQIRDRIQLLMGKQCKVDFEFPEDIECTQSGKYRYVISHIAR